MQTKKKINMDTRTAVTYFFLNENKDTIKGNFVVGITSKTKDDTF